MPEDIGSAAGTGFPGQDALGEEGILSFENGRETASRLQEDKECLENRVRQLEEEKEALQKELESARKECEYAKLLLNSYAQLSARKDQAMIEEECERREKEEAAKAGSSFRRKARALRDRFRKQDD